MPSKKATLAGVLGIVVALLVAPGFLVTSGAPLDASTCTAPAWSATAIYTVGNQVLYSGNLYQAKWWTQGDNPSLSGQWDV
jgi:chitodextrinase